MADRLLTAAAVLPTARSFVHGLRFTAALALAVIMALALVGRGLAVAFAFAVILALTGIFGVHALATVFSFTGIFGFGGRFICSSSGVLGKTIGSERAGIKSSDCSSHDDQTCLLSHIYIYYWVNGSTANDIGH